MKLRQGIIKDGRQGTKQGFGKDGQRWTRQSAGKEGQRETRKLRLGIVGLSQWEPGLESGLESGLALVSLADGDSGSSGQLRLCGVWTGHWVLPVFVRSVVCCCHWGLASCHMGHGLFLSRWQGLFLAEGCGQLWARSMVVTGMWPAEHGCYHVAFFCHRSMALWCVLFLSQGVGSISVREQYRLR